MLQNYKNYFKKNCKRTFKKQRHLLQLICYLFSLFYTIF